MHSRQTSQSSLSFLGWVPTMFVSLPFFGPPLSEKAGRKFCSPVL
jgi:hypothetical protein